MTNKMPVVGKRYVNKKTNKDYELFFTHKEAFYLKNTKDDLASAETLVEFWNRFEELPEDNLQEKKEISEVERALEELEQAMSKSLGKITCVNDVNKITFKLMDVRKAAQNLVNALEVEKNMPNPKPKIDMKEECVEPVSIWKDVSELPKILEGDTVDSLIRDKNGNVTRTIFYNQNGEIDHSPSGLEFEKEYCSLTDFVKSFEQMQKDIEELKRK